MPARPLNELLAHYTPCDECEAEALAQLQNFLSSLPETAAAFSDEIIGAGLPAGHITVSAWVTNCDASRVVLVHHAKTNRWVPPGGHCIRNSDLLATALHYAREETGLEVSPCNDGIFDIDVGCIPHYWNTPAHLHYEVCLLFQADDKRVPVTSAHAHAARWVTMDEAISLSRESVMLRLINKTRQLAAL